MPIEQLTVPIVLQPIYFIFFIVSVFIAFYIPGTVILNSHNIKMRWVYALGIGLTFWALQGFLFGYLKIRWATYLYLIIMFVFWIKQKGYKNLQVQLPIKINRLSIFLIISGTLLLTSTVAANGLLTKKGLFFCCGDTSDLIFHAALTKQIIRQIPPEQPGLPGVLIKNYHYLSNLSVAELVRIFHLPLFPTLYLWMGIFIASMYGLSALAFSTSMNMPDKFKHWLLFFLYFGGDLIYLLLIFRQNPNIFSMSSLEDGSTFLINPPRAYAVVLFFIGSGLLWEWLKNHKTKLGIISMIVLGSLIGFKVYIGIFALIGLFSLGIYLMFKRDYKTATLLFIAPLISLSVYIPVNSQAGGLFFTGLWRFENFFTQPALGLSYLELRREIYTRNHNVLRIIQIELIYIILYISSIFGTKLLALFQNRKSLQNLPFVIHLYILIPIIFSLILGFFFQQNTGGANTFNFLVSAFIFGSIYAALSTISLKSFISTKWVYMLFMIFIILLTIPRVCRNIYVNLSNIYYGNGFLISNEDINSFKFIRNNVNPNKKILIDPDYFSFSSLTPYIKIFVDNPFHIAGKKILKDHGIDFSLPEFQEQTMLATTSAALVSKLMTDSNIDLILTGSNIIFNATPSACITNEIYSNKKVLILEKIHYSEICAKSYKTSSLVTNQEWSDYEYQLQQFILSQ